MAYNYIYYYSRVKTRVYTYTKILLFHTIILYVNYIIILTDKIYIKKFIIMIVKNYVHIQCKASVSKASALLWPRLRVRVSHSEYAL